MNPPPEVDVQFVRLSQRSPTALPYKLHVYFRGSVDHSSDLSIEVDRRIRNV